MTRRTPASIATRSATRTSLLLEQAKICELL